MSSNVSNQLVADIMSQGHFFGTCGGTTPSPRVEEKETDREEENKKEGKGRVKVRQRCVNGVDGEDGENRENRMKRRTNKDNVFQSIIIITIIRTRFSFSSFEHHQFNIRRNDSTA